MTAIETHADLSDWNQLELINLLFRMSGVAPLWLSGASSLITIKIVVYFLCKLGQIARMTNQQIEQRMHTLVKTEKRITREIVWLIQMAYERKLHLQKYANVFQWLTQEFKYSEGSANRRIQAARILEVAPEAVAKLESGELNLSTLTQAQAAIRREEKRIGEALPREQKQQIVAAIENKSMKETEMFLAATFPEQAPPEKTRAINASESLLELVTDTEFAELLEQVKALLSNKEEPTTLAALKESMKAFIAAAPAKQSVKRRMLLKRAGHQCEWSEQGKRCTSKRTLQEDHIIPWAMGGSDDIENMRMLCRPHNLLHAENCFGKEKIRNSISSAMSDKVMTFGRDESVGAVFDSLVDGSCERRSEENSCGSA